MPIASALVAFGKFAQVPNPIFHLNSGPPRGPFLYPAPLNGTYVLKDINWVKISLGNM